MPKNDRVNGEISSAFSPIRTRRRSGKQLQKEKHSAQADSSEEDIKEPSSKRIRHHNVSHSEMTSMLPSRPRTRSFNLDVEVRSAQDLLMRKGNRRGVLSATTANSKKQRQSPKKVEEQQEVRRSHRESRKVFESLNEHTLVRSLVGDYLPPNSTVKKRRQVLDEAETDSQGENQSGYLTMYDRIKGKTKSDKDDDEDDDDKEESGSDDEDDEDEDDEDEDDMPQQRYKLRENKPITKRYTAPPPKSYHSSRRGLFSTSQHHRERACVDKQPFSPVRRRYKLKRKTINESSTSTEEEDDDNRKFERRKAKSMAKARNRCLPMNLASGDVNKGILADRERIGSSLADVDPMNVDRSITFESIGGLGKYVRSLKEMVVFPLLYPEVFEKFKVNPSRGVLFHGPPGTGKTLMARALANECSQDEKKVAFFMRKGADCLSKWVGESERQLRLLFDQAFKMRPSIIFFDEIDGLAPVRSSRQDQIHSSIVSTLLALMDGLDNRGEIVVIGATNRIDSIDPALRRPGRFDREFIFPLPDKQARRNILSIHTKDWQPRLTQNFINDVADECVGYCGADIKALCTEATLLALRRRYPQIYASKKKLVLDVNTVRVCGKDFAKAIKTLVPACQRAVVAPGRALSASIRHLLHGVLTRSWEMLTNIFPHALCKTVGESSPGSSVSTFGIDSESSDDDDDDADIYEIDPTSSEGAREARAARAARRAGVKLSASGTSKHFHYFTNNSMTSKHVHRPRFLVCGERGMGQSTHVSQALLHSMEHIPVHCLDLPALFGCSSKTAEEACAQIFREARRVAPSIVYLPHVDSLWSTTTDTLKATFLSLVNDLPSNLPLLLFATCDLPLSKIPPDLAFFSFYQVFEVPYPAAEERSAYLEPLFLTEALKLPCLAKKTKVKKPLEVLPLAPAQEPRELTVKELERVRDDEENTLRELRIFLREITVKLMSDRKFKEFYKPVDLEEVPDYLNVIETPMDLTTMLQKVDGHQYQTCKEYLQDIDLITSNALEYNPNADSLDRLIRHRACALKDCAGSLIKTQLDLDFEKACEDIAESRKRRGDSRNVCAPKFFPVAPVKSSCTSQPATSTSKPETATRLSRRVRGLTADVDIQLECLPQKTISRLTKRTAREAKKDSEVIEGKQETRSPKPKGKKRRRCRFTRKSTPARSGLVSRTAEASDVENEEAEAEWMTDDNMEGTALKNGLDEVGLAHGIECFESKELDAVSVDSTIKEKERADKLTINDGNPDPFTNHYINSLRMRSEVKTALKSHLDSLNSCVPADKPDSKAGLPDNERSSDAKNSLATSEVSNCDSKDVAELDSVLSASPHQNGLTCEEADKEHDVISDDEDDIIKSVTETDNVVELTKENDVTMEDDVTRDDDVTKDNDVTHDQVSSIWDVDKALNSVEKSKRVLFMDERDMQEDQEVNSSEKLEEDKGRFSRLLERFVEASNRLNVEKLELWHTRITQCIVQHKKDPSRTLLYEDLQSLLKTLKAMA